MLLTDHDEVWGKKVPIEEKEHYNLKALGKENCFLKRNDIMGRLRIKAVRSSVCVQENFSDGKV